MTRVDLFFKSEETVIKYNMIVKSRFGGSSSYKHKQKDSNELHS